MGTTAFGDAMSGGVFATNTGGFAGNGALAAGVGAVESPAVAKAAAGRAGRAALTPAQMEARAQQRLEDDELIRQAQRGERDAFDQLVRRYDGAVLRLALHMLGNEQDAQDVHQEAFLKAYRH